MNVFGLKETSGFLFFQIFPKATDISLGKAACRKQNDRTKVGEIGIVVAAILDLRHRGLRCTELEFDGNRARKSSNCISSLNA